MRDYYQKNCRDIERFVENNVYANVTGMVTELMQPNIDEWWHLVEQIVETEYEEEQPYAREVFSYFIVNEYLAKYLKEKGEPIEHDFYGSTIWGRTTYGQSISMDGVVIDIYKDIYGDEDDE